MLRICDPHIHLWDLSTGLYPGLEKPSTSFIGDNTAIARDYLLPEFLNEAGEDIELVGAIHVEAFPTYPPAEVEAVSNATRRAPVPIGIVGNADLTREDLADLLDRMGEYPMFRGIRQVVNLHPNTDLSYTEVDYLAQPAFGNGVAELGRRDLSFDLQLYPHQAKAAAGMIAANPDTTFIVNHAAMWADRNSDGWRRWKVALRELAEPPNVLIKISGLGMFDHDWTVESFRPLVYETLEAFGPGRTMFASNFPVDKLFGSYVALWRGYASIVSDLNESERTGLFSDVALRAYRLSEPR